MGSIPRLDELGTAELEEVRGEGPASGEEPIEGSVLLTPEPFERV